MACCREWRTSLLASVDRQCGGRPDEHLDSARHWPVRIARSAVAMDFTRPSVASIVRRRPFNRELDNIESCPTSQFDRDACQRSGSAIQSCSQSIPNQRRADRLLPGQRRRQPNGSGQPSVDCMPLLTTRRSRSRKIRIAGSGLVGAVAMLNRYCERRPRQTVLLSSAAVQALICALAAEQTAASSASCKVLYLDATETSDKQRTLPSRRRTSSGPDACCTL